MRARERETAARTLREEVLVVLSLSLLASAVYAIISLTSAPIEGVKVFVIAQVGLATQLANVAFGLAPVWLVVFLVRRSGEGLGAIGLARDRPRSDVLRGAALFVVVGAVGIGVYLTAVAIGVNRFVVPVPPLGHWWTVPVLFLASAEAALVEEVIVAGYLITRLGQLGWGAAAAVGTSALLRGAYHLYQGWGGFAGNLALGLFFGLFFLRTRRTWPLVVAHFLLDVGSGIGFLLFREHLPGFS
ncbi:MAG: CPBP family intramembrane glutamic endopeptidase [Actinomycetota bacterium]